MAIRTESDMNVKTKDFQIRRKEELMIMKQRYTKWSRITGFNSLYRETNVAMKALRKAKFQYEFVQKSVPELQNMLADIQRDLEGQKQKAKQQMEVVSQN